MKKIFTLTLSAALLLTASVLHAQTTELGVFSSFDNIGDPAIPGTVTFDPKSGIYTLTGSGKNIWFSDDSFSYLSRPVFGDFSLSASMGFVGTNPIHRKIGIMLRESKAPSSAMMCCTVHGDGLTSFQYRKQTGTDVEETKCSLKFGEYISMTRRNGTVYISVFGKNGEVESWCSDFELDDSAFAGIFICSHDDAVSEKCEYWNVLFSNGFSHPGRAQTSFLEILDVNSGKRTVIKEFDKVIEAPNWTADGKYLIFNSEGRMYRIRPQKGAEPEEINTGFAQKCNNDHVLSPDNSMLAVSHHTFEDNKSRIYVLPSEGGNPELVTPLGESYLHGWSPDGKYLSYCANRKGNFDVYIIPADGGKEIRLTDTDGLDDGPEYSPDGKTIWFNSVRTGLMQVWKMNADGSNQTQMTFDDDLNSWFPHISPDGTKVIYISYHKGDLKPGEHLADKNVLLRMIPAEGGKPVTVAELFGGQGTINVNSWSPDSRKVAFVSYSK